MSLGLKFYYLELISHRLFKLEETLELTWIPYFAFRKIDVCHEGNEGRSHSKLLTMPQLESISPNSRSSALHIHGVLFLVIYPWEIFKTVNHHLQGSIYTQNIAWSFRDSIDCLELYYSRSREPSFIPCCLYSVVQKVKIGLWRSVWFIPVTALQHQVKITGTWALGI